MANQEIAFGLKIDGVEQTIKSVKDLKGAISALQAEAETADIGSEQYKNAIENIEKLNDKLREVTQTEKQAAKATEELAEAEKEAAKETGDLRNQFSKLEDELFMLAGQGKQNTKEFRDLADEAAVLNERIELVNQSLEGGAATKSAEGYQMLSGSFTSLKEGILELDFGKVKDGLMQAKEGFVMFGQGAKTALQGVKGALLATGIGALVVALGVIVAYWDDIKGAVSGVSSEQKKLNENSALNLKTQQDKLTAISAQENILKLQGKSEKEILQMKMKQTDEAITASDIAIQQAETTKKAQVEASKRNHDILNGIISFISTPITSLLESIDLVGKAFGKNFGLAESFAKSDSIAKLLFDPEQVASEADKAIAEAKLANDKLKNDRAGLQLSINKIDTDAAKTASEKAKSKLEAEIAVMKQIQDAYIANEKNEEKKAIQTAYLNQQRRFEEINKTIDNEILKQEAIKASEKTFQNEMAAIYQTKLDKEKALNDSRVALNQQMLDQKHAQQIAQDEIDGAAMVAKAEKEKAVEMATKDAIFKMAQNSIASLQGLSDIYFLFKTKNLEKGSAAELDAAKKQFNINKALQIASATIAGIQGVQNALTEKSILPAPLSTAFRISNAIVTGIASAANIAKIAASKFDAGGGGGGGGSASIPSAPSIPPPPTIATPENNTNKTTSFDETGKNLNFQGTPTPTINVKASVGVDEITSKSNRVEVLENQSTF